MALSLLIALVTGLVLGFVTSIPLGPVAAMVIQMAVRHDRRAAFLCALGCASVDGVYSLAASLGVVRVLDAWPAALPIMYILGGLVLTVFAVQIFRGVKTPQTQVSTVPPRRRAFFAGLVLAATNPVPLLAWVGLSGTVLSTLPRPGVPLFSLGVLGGVLAWFSVVTEVSLRGKKLEAGHLRIVSRAIGVLLLVSAGLCAWRAVSTLRLLLSPE